MLLWSGTLSPFSAKIRIYLHERQLPHTRKEIPWSRQSLWGPKPAEFLQASPRGEVPALVDGDLSIFDSTLIWEYLEDRYPDNPLAPTDPAGKARCRMWEELADHAMAKHLTILIRDVFLSEADTLPREARDSMAYLQEYYQVLESALATQDYLTEHFSIADIATYVCLLFCQTLGAAIPQELTALTTWFERVGLRPAVAQEVAQITTSAAAA